MTRRLLYFIPILCILYTGIGRAGVVERVELPTLQKYIKLHQLVIRSLSSSEATEEDCSQAFKILQHIDYKIVNQIYINKHEVEKNA